MTFILNRKTLQSKTNDDSLKYFLEQRMYLEEQQKWVTNMPGCDFEIFYKKGKQNIVADAVARKEEDTKSLLYVISTPQYNWMEEAMIEWK